MASILERLGPKLPSRYRLIREIGRGGAARVFLAQETHPQREVAIKVLDPAIAALVGPERFLREVDLASKLSHPHILPIFAAGDADGLLYYVMPYLAGDTLRALLERDGFLPLYHALQIAREVADALSYAHAQGIVHRDIKPENVLMQAGHAIVADFGVARLIQPAGKRAITQSGLAVGTPAYMSPEQAAGTEAVDGRTDIYSLACVLYEMLTGRTPHEGSSADLIIWRKVNEPAPRASGFRVGLPEGIDAALATALAQAPEDRYAGADQFRDALSPYLSPVATLVSPSDAATTTAVSPVAPLVYRDSKPTVVSPLSVRRAKPVPLAWALTTRTRLTVVLAVILAVDWLQTSLDNGIAAHSALAAELRHQFAHAMQWLEGGLSFARHDVTNAVALYGYSSAYFLLFPVLLAAVAFFLARRRAIAPYRAVVVATGVAYMVSLPFYVFFPVPERWSFSESGAVLLSDRWTTGLIEAMRPISGLDNCFPSSHVSLTVIVVAAAFVFGLRARWTVLALGSIVVLSTFVLGVHWIADIVAGASVGLIGLAVALRVERRLSGWPIHAAG
jgi:serine/threonine protein kinase